MSEIPRFSKASLVVTTLLCGCAALTPVPTGQALIGQSSPAVEAQFGRAPEQYPRAEGGVRWLYPTRPLGPYTYAADFDQSGRLTAFNQILTARNFFSTVRVGQSTQDDVLREFGKPDSITDFPSMGGMRVWSYRFLNDGWWWSSMNFYFDGSNVVRHTQITNDPLNLQIL